MKDFKNLEHVGYATFSLLLLALLLMILDIVRIIRSDLNNKSFYFVKGTCVHFLILFLIFSSVTAYFYAIITLEEIYFKLWNFRFSFYFIICTYPAYLFCCIYYR